VSFVSCNVSYRNVWLQWLESVVLAVKCVLVYWSLDDAEVVIRWHLLAVKWEIANRGNDEFQYGSTSPRDQIFQSAKDSSTKEEKQNLINLYNKFHCSKPIDESRKSRQPTPQCRRHAILLITRRIPSPASILPRYLNLHISNIQMRIYRHTS
jgi:hypothetical protein